MERSLEYDSKTSTVNPIKLREVMNFFPYERVPDEMINGYLKNNDFINVKGDHMGCYDTIEKHAQIIASIIHLIQDGEIMKPVVLYVENDGTRDKIEIDDGFHRFRAYLYLKIRFPVVLVK